MTETIFAPSSGNRRAGVCVVRVSGDGCRMLLDRVVGRRCDPRRACLRTLRDPQTGEIVDRCLVLWFPAPASFTGEDVVELHVHGGRAVVDATLNALGRLPGFRLAEPGEFTRRAFESGKLDLSEVEGLADLINARTEVQRRLALREAGGRLRARYEAWRESLLNCLALVEADIDFVEEDDVPEDAVAGVKRKLDDLLKDIGRLRADPRRGEIARRGFRVVIAGLPNVGKSSLLNRIAQRDVAIVTETAGTTRDVVEAFLDLAGYPVAICDTAGLRPARDEVERIGVERAGSEIREADLVVWVCDERGEWPDMSLRADDSDAMRIRNKADLPPCGKVRDEDPRPSLAVSAHSGEGMTELLARIQSAAEKRFELAEDVGVTRERHAECIGACGKHVSAALGLLARPDGPDVELLAEELRLAARALAKIGGRVDVEDVLDRIFGEFCIGK